MSDRPYSPAAVALRKLRQEAAERDAWDAGEEERARRGAELAAARPSIDVDELVIPGLDDVAFWDEAERLHVHTPAPHADLQECARIVARRRRENPE